jgi:hypothetical protein
MRLTPFGKKVVTAINKSQSERVTVGNLALTPPSSCAWSSA